MKQIKKPRTNTIKFHNAIKKIDVKASRVTWNMVKQLLEEYYNITSKSSDEKIITIAVPQSKEYFLEIFYKGSSMSVLNNFDVEVLYRDNHNHWRTIDKTYCDTARGLFGAIDSYINHIIYYGKFLGMEA